MVHIRIIQLLHILLLTCKTVLLYPRSTTCEYSWWMVRSTSRHCTSIRQLWLLNGWFWLDWYCHRSADICWRIFMECFRSWLGVVLQYNVPPWNNNESLNKLCLKKKRYNRGECSIWSTWWNESRPGASLCCLSTSFSHISRLWCSDIAREQYASTLALFEKLAMTGVLDHFNKPRQVRRPSP